MITFLRDTGTDPARLLRAVGRGGGEGGGAVHNQISVRPSLTFFQNFGWGFDPLDHPPCVSIIPGHKNVNSNFSESTV